MDYEALIARLRLNAGDKSKSAMQRDCEAAADAITKLRAERDALQEIVNAPQNYITISRAVHGARLAEITQLRAELAREKQEHDRATTFHATAVKERDALTALLRDCLPELDGEGVTIHRVWAALAKDAK